MKLNQKIIPSCLFLFLIIALGLALFSCLKANNNSGISKTNSDQLQMQPKIYGGIVSHHLVAQKHINDFFLNLNYDYPTIVVIGPNHFNFGDYNISTTDQSFNTDFGILESDKKTVQTLTAEKIAHKDSKLFEKEHSILTLTEFIKKYQPKTKIVPIILKANTKKEEAALLAQQLNKIIPQNSLVIASVDFSHHLNKNASKLHDEKSISVIKNFDFDRIYKLEIDSPASIYALLNYLEEKQVKEIKYTNTNAADIFDNENLEDVTSYVFAYFYSGHAEISNPGKGAISFLHFGDMMFGRYVGEKIKKGMDPFEKIKGQENNFLKNYDFILGNLEGPITLTDNCRQKAYSFKFEPKIAEILKNNNFTSVNLTNNHSLDCNMTGLEDTKNYLKESGIEYFGGSADNNNILIKEVADQKIAFLGIDKTASPNQDEAFIDLIADLRRKVDFIIVDIHWGIEYQTSPSKQQQDFGHSLIDSGADLIIGHHPHVVQPVEVYKNKAIFYSLGNFIFDQDLPGTTTGLAIGTVTQNNKVSYYLFPITLINYQPELLKPQESLKICEKILNSVEENQKKGCILRISN